MVSKNDATTCVHDEIGMYNCELDATDTNTVGQLTLTVHEAGALHVRHDYQVIDTEAYDLMYADGATPVQDINAEVDTALSDIGLDHLVSVAVIGTDVTDDSIVAKLVSSAATADWDNFVNTTDSLQAIRDRGDAAWTTGAGGTGLTPLASGTAQGGAAGTIQLAAGETFADNELNGTVCNIVGGTGVGQSRVITAYTGATDTATVSPNWTTTPDATSVYEVVNGSVNVTAVSNVAEDIATATALATVDTVVDGIQTDLDNGTDGLGAIKGDTAAILTDTADMQPKIGTPAANVSADIAAIKAETALIVADTNELQTDDVPGLIAALNDLSAAAVNAEVDTALADYDGPTKAEMDALLTTAQTEAYAVDGATASPAQLLYMIWAMLAEANASGTTLTVKKLDGSTTAMTFTLDDGSSPTTITRAT